MRTPFAHDAVLTMATDADPGAPGAAITVALCGHWEHEPPCPLAPHHTAVVLGPGDDVHLRVLFAAEPEREPEIRTRISEALATQWHVRSSTPGVIHPGESDHAARLVRS